MFIHTHTLTILYIEMCYAAKCIELLLRQFGGQRAVACSVVFMILPLTVTYSTT